METAKGFHLSRPVACSHRRGRRRARVVLDVRGLQECDLDTQKPTAYISVPRRSRVRLRAFLQRFCSVSGWGRTWEGVDRKWEEAGRAGMWKGRRREEGAAHLDILQRLCRALQRDGLGTLDVELHEVVGRVARQPCVHATTQPRQGERGREGETRREEAGRGGEREERRERGTEPAQHSISTPAPNLCTSSLRLPTPDAKREECFVFVTCFLHDLVDRRHVASLLSCPRPMNCPDKKSESGGGGRECGSCAELCGACGKVASRACVDATHWCFLGRRWSPHCTAHRRTSRGTSPPSRCLRQPQSGRAGRPPGRGGNAVPGQQHR